MLSPNEQSQLSVLPLPAKLEPEHILTLLPSLGYEMVMGNEAPSESILQTPLYFQHHDILVFPPSTDNPLKSSSKLLGIEATVEKALQHIQENNALEDKSMLIFPVYEEWQARGLSWEPRKHWVLLVYVKKEQKLYFLDSKGPTLSATLYGHQLHHMESAAKNALSIDLKLELPHPLTKLFSDRQDASDAQSSGYWIAYSLYRFNQSVDLAGLQVDLKDKKIGTITEIITQARQTYASRSNGEDVSPDVSRKDHEQHLGVVVDPASIERQDYAMSIATTEHQPLNNTSSHPPADSLLQSSTQINPASVPISAQPPGNHPASAPWYRFKLDVYSALIYVGAVVVLLALLGLASVVPLVSTTVSAGALGLGVVMVLSGILGKCGIFPARSASNPGPVQPTAELRSNV